MLQRIIQKTYELPEVPKPQNYDPQDFGMQDGLQQLAFESIMGVKRNEYGAWQPQHPTRSDDFQSITDETQSPGYQPKRFKNQYGGPPPAFQYTLIPLFPEDLVMPLNNSFDTAQDLQLQSTGSNAPPTINFPMNSKLHIPMEEPMFTSPIWSL